MHRHCVGCGPAGKTNPNGETASAATRVPPSKTRAIPSAQHNSAGGAPTTSDSGRISSGCFPGPSVAELPVGGLPAVPESPAAEMGFPSPELQRPRGERPAPTAGAVAWRASVLRLAHMNCQHVRTVSKLTL